MPANFNADRYDFRRPVQIAEGVTLLPRPVEVVIVILVRPAAKRTR